MNSKESHVLCVRVWACNCLKHSASSYVMYLLYVQLFFPPDCTVIHGITSTSLKMLLIECGILSSYIAEMLISFGILVGFPPTEAR